MSSSNNNILITGATGFIGKHLISLIADDGNYKHVSVLVRRNSKNADINFIRTALKNVKITEGDITDINSLRKATEGCNYIINLAGKADYKKTRDLEDVNVRGVENICKVALENNTEKLVHISSTASLGHSENINDIRDESYSFNLYGKGYHYAESKHRGDEICLNYHERHGLPVIICMPSEVYGEYGYETAKNILDLLNFPVAWNGGTSVVYVKDVAWGILEALRNGRNGEKYIIASDNMTIYEIIHKCLKAADKHSRIYRIPNFILNYPLRYISSVQEILGFSPLFDPHVIRYATKYWFVSSEKAQKELNFNPADGNTTIKRTVEWLIDENLV